MDLEKFIKQGRKHVPFDRIATLPSNTLDMLSERCINFESRQSAYVQLLDEVKNNDVSRIGLCGMGGCGKTTLAMEVMKFVEAEQKVLFVAVSNIVEVRRIQEKIASSLQFELPETEELGRAQRLCLRLIQEKNIFIILDDVWEKLDFGRIGIPSSEYHKGCKILITSRSEAVCTLMDCQSKIYLSILADEEAWTLFQNKAFITEDTPDTLKDLGRSISYECEGLPVAIAAVASSLKGKPETVWSVALNKLRSCKQINIEKGLIDPYKCVQLSYDNLDTEEAKSLFLLCSVFPEDFEIPVEVLTRCAIGLGVVGEAHSYEEARSEVIAAKIKLVSCCLLLDADDERVKMHDLVRDVAHLIAKNENKMIRCEEENDVTVEQNSIRYLWCVKFPKDLDCSNLEFLFLRTKMKEFDGIFKRMGMLKVLILVNDEDGKTPLSTISFKTLTNLRGLFIFNYELSDFSFISGMKNLQSLSLFDCLLPSFPELQNGAYELEELVGCKQGRTKVELPRLKLLIFMHLKNFCQDIEFHNLKNCIVYKCPTLSLTSTTTLQKLRQDFPYRDFINTEDDRLGFKRIVRFIYEDSTVSGSSEFTSSQGPRIRFPISSTPGRPSLAPITPLNPKRLGPVRKIFRRSSQLDHKKIKEIEDVGNESIKSSSTGVEDTGIGDAVATHIDSKVVEQDDKMNEGKPGIVASQGIHVEEGLNLLHKQEGIDVVPKSLLKMCSSGDVVLDSQAVEEGDGPKISLEEGSDLVDKESEIGVVSNDRIVAPRNEELEMEFVAKVFTSEIPRIATTSTNSQPVESPTPSCLNMPLRETPANALEDKQRISEPCLMNQQKPFGEITTEQGYVEETIAKNTNMAASSILSEPFSTQFDQKITFQNKSHPYSEITSSQPEAGTDKEIDHPKITQGFGTNDVISLFASGKESEDSPVGKTLAELEKFLKMSLKDVVSSETDTLRLWSNLNLLSNLPFKDVTLSDGLKRIIDNMLQHFPTILRSFKEGFATTDKLGKLEACQNEVAATLVSKISEAENFYNEAQLKEVVLKEQIKVCEAALSSLGKEKNKCIAETIEYKKELENVMKDRSQMLEDKRKVEQELFDVAYKWSVLCIEYELNRMAATNIP